MSQLISEITVETSALAVGGEALGSVVAGPAELIGKKAFVAKVVPGERVQARVADDRARLLHADLLRLDNPHPARVTPRCEVFDRCGGCQLQHIELGAQREFKRAMVASMLARQAGIEPRHPITLLGSELPGYAYRRRVSLHLNKSGQLGFYRQGTEDIVEFSECHIASQKINQAIAALREPVASFAGFIGALSFEEAEAGVALVCALSDGASCSIEDWRRLVDVCSKIFIELKLVRGRSLLQRWSAEPEFAGAAGHFSQVNLKANAKLIAAVVEELRGQTSVLEFYAGSGNFSFALAKAGMRVRAVELDSELVRQGKHVAASLDLNERVIFEACSTELFIKKRWPKATILPQALLLDPPRSGAAALCEQLVKTPPQRVVYVSCSLPTFTRDLKTLSAVYSLKSVQVLDMFPQTYHVEMLGVLEAR